MTTSPAQNRKVVVVHRGARDHYQAALAMAEAGILERLVTDLYWSEESLIAQFAKRYGGQRAGRLIGAHAHAPIPRRLVETSPAASLASFALDKIAAAPFSWRARATRQTDAALGTVAGKIAREHGAALLSYSYYAHSAFEAAGPDTARILFQLHPHPASMRRLLRQELAAHPECASSLEKEWELALSEQDFARLSEEPGMAQHWIAASSFTRQTLVENGIPGERVHVASYGVDAERFTPLEDRTPRETGPLRILFVGTVNQRKGIKYLLEAVRQLNTSQIQLVIRGRAVDDLALVHKLVPDVDLRLSVSQEELLEAYRTSDLFVFPSVGEGFGHVLLESLASGLPVLSTTHTAAPDLLTPGVDGFVVEPRSSAALAERLEWALSHRRQVAIMRGEARATALRFTWERFRAQLRNIVGHALAAPVLERGVAEHV